MINKEIELEIKKIRESIFNKTDEMEDLIQKTKPEIKSKKAIKKGKLKLSK